MDKLNTEFLKSYIKERGVVYQPINCLIEADQEETVCVRDFISSQITENNWEILTKCKAQDKGFEELADWAIEDDYIIAIELSKPINNEYYVSVCFPISDFKEIG